MSQRARPPGVAEVRDGLRQWTGVVEVAARRRRRCFWIGPHEYRTLYERLLQACRAQAALAPEKDRPFYRELAERVQPWLTLETLARGDHDILADLLAECRRAERRLGIRRWRLPLPPAAVIMGLLGMGMVGVAVLVWIPDRPYIPFLDPLRLWLEDGWWAVRRLSWAERIYALSTLVILAYMYVVSRAART